MPHTAIKTNLSIPRYPSHDQLELIYLHYLAPVLQQQLGRHQVWSNQSKVRRLASSMVQVYNQLRAEFSVDDYSHYLFTPRDLTRWVLGLLRYDLKGLYICVIMPSGLTRVCSTEKWFRLSILNKVNFRTYDVFHTCCQLYLTDIVLKVPIELLNMSLPC